MRTLIALALTGVLAGCEMATEPKISETTFAASLNVDLSTMTVTSTGLYYKDLIVGTGAATVSGQPVSIHYVGNLPGGLQFDANTAPATPFKFTLGVGQVIAGFDQGVTGMNVGGRRQVIIPASLAYGHQAVGNIPANSILVFTIDVVSVP